MERADGSWLDVLPRKNSLVVNIGATFSKMADNRIKATMLLDAREGHVGSSWSPPIMLCSLPDSLLMGL